MAKGTFRFYEELNDFLPEHRQKIDFEAKFKERKSIKDIIEECGVPPTQVDLVLINGKSVDFNTIFQDGDRVSVYPVFESFNIQNVTQLRRLPLRRIQFIADINDRIKPFSRCLRCNNPLGNRQIKQIMDRLLLGTKSIFEKYLLCTSCGKQDWRKK